MAHISLVSPVYMAENILPELVERIIKAVKQITDDFEIILVEDGSPDQSWAVIERLAKKHQFVKGIKLSRNFGQHYAITAGLDHANGDWVVVMDCDLQDQPEEISKFYTSALSGYDIVLGRRILRKDRFIKKMLSICYYRLLNYMTDNSIDPTVGTYRIMSSRVVKNFATMSEKLRYFGAMINWLGFKTGYIDIDHREREEGESTYSLKRRIQLGLDGIVAFSDKPLRLTVKLGFLISSISITSIIIIISRNLIYGTSVVGWTSLIASIFFSLGLIVLILGVVGIYLGKVFEEVKNRPNYIIMQYVNLKNIKK